MMRRLNPMVVPLNDMRGWKAFIEPCVNSDTLRSKAQLAGLALVGVRSDAEIFIAEDPLHPGDRTLWWAVLRGCTVATPDFSSYAEVI